MDAKTWIKKNPATAYATIEDYALAAFQAGQQNSKSATNPENLDFFILEPGNDFEGGYLLHQNDDGQWQWEFTGPGEQDPAIDFGPLVPTRKEALQSAISDAIKSAGDDHRDDLVARMDAALSKATD